MDIRQLRGWLLRLFGLLHRKRREREFASEQELLFFTLFSLKAELTYDLLELVCGMDAANAKRNQELGLRVLEQALASAGCLPKREFKNAAEFAEYLKNEKTLTILMKCPLTHGDNSNDSTF